MSNEASSKPSVAELSQRLSDTDANATNYWIPGRRLKLVTDYYNLGFEFRDASDMRQAKDCFRKGAEVVAGKRPRKFRRSTQLFKLVASCKNHHGLVELNENQFVDAESWFQSAIELREKLERLFPDDDENVVGLGGAWCNLGLAVTQRNAEEAIGHFHKSLDILRSHEKPCACSYWDENRESWFCGSLQTMADAARIEWVFLWPQFIDNAMYGLSKAKEASSDD